MQFFFVLLCQKNANMTILYLVRHGETVDNANQIMQGQTQGELNEKGIAQAREVAEKLLGEHFDAFVSSDSMSSGHSLSFKSGMYFPVKLPQSLSLNKGVVITSFPWGSAMIEAVSNDRFKSLETMASNCSTARFFATVRACSMPFVLSSP